MNSKNLSHFKRNCSYCKSVFFTNVPNKEYCSVKCRKDNYLPKEREYRSKHTQEFRRKVMVLCYNCNQIKVHENHEICGRRKYE